MDSSDADAEGAGPLNAKHNAADEMDSSESMAQPLEAPIANNNHTHADTENDQTEGCSKPCDFEASVSEEHDGISAYVQDDLSTKHKYPPVGMSHSHSHSIYMTPRSKTHRVYFGEATHPSAAVHVPQYSEQSPNSSLEEYSSESMSPRRSWLAIEIVAPTKEQDDNLSPWLCYICSKYREGPADSTIVRADAQRRLRRIMLVSILFSVYKVAYIIVHTMVAIMSHTVLLVFHVVLYTTAAGIGVFWSSHATHTRANALSESIESLDLRSCSSSKFQKRWTLAIGLLCTLDGMFFFAEPFVPGDPDPADAHIEGVMHIIGGILEILLPIYYRIEWNTLGGRFLLVCSRTIYPAGLHAIVEACGSIFEWNSILRSSVTVIFGAVYILMGTVISCTALSGLCAAEHYHCGPQRHVRHQK